MFSSMTAVFLLTCVLSALWLGRRLISMSYTRGARVDLRGKAVLVTGCDTGFGHDLARRLHALGFKVFAGCLDAKGEGATDLLAAASRPQTKGSGRDQTLKVVQMDVSKDEDVDSAVNTLSRFLHKDEGLWAVVNNAGLSTFGDVEWCSLHTYKHLAEVNVWGGVRVVKAFLPLLRKAKGRVVQVTSGLGRQAVPGRSCYVLTKYAMEGFAQCLRYELRRWGVHVSIIEPGNFIAATGIFTPEKIGEIAGRMWEGASEETRQAYGKDAFDAEVEKMTRYSQYGTKDTSPVIEAMIAAVTDRRPRIRYEPKDWYWHIRTFVMVVLPQEIGDWLYLSR